MVAQSVIKHVKQEHNMLKTFVRYATSTLVIDQSGPLSQLAANYSAVQELKCFQVAEALTRQCQVISQARYQSMRMTRDKLESENTS